jgi:hypothetical protein
MDRSRNFFRTSRQQRYHDGTARVLTGPGTQVLGGWARVREYSVAGPGYASTRWLGGEDGHPRRSRPLPVLLQRRGRAEKRRKHCTPPAFTHTPTYTYTHVHAHTHTHTHAHTHTHTHARTHARTHRQTHTHRDTETHARTSAHPHLHMQLRDTPRALQRAIRPQSGLKDGYGTGL